MGIKALPNEEAVATAMRSAITQPGFYIFPAPNMTSGRSKEQQNADMAEYMSKYRQGPSGILIYSVGGKDFNYAQALVNQFLMNLVAALILAWILAMVASGTSFGARALIVLLAGIFGGVVYVLPYWNWYGFPLTYVCGDIGELGGGLGVGRVGDGEDCEAVADGQHRSKWICFGFAGLAGCAGVGRSCGWRLLVGCRHGGRRYEGG